MASIIIFIEQLNSLVAARLPIAFSNQQLGHKFADNGLVLVALYTILSPAHSPCVYLSDCAQYYTFKQP
jgi:hypothetical protein